MCEIEHLRQVLEKYQVELGAAIWDVMYSSPADQQDRMELRQLQAQIDASCAQVRHWLLFFQLRYGLGRKASPARSTSEDLALYGA